MLSGDFQVYDSSLPYLNLCDSRIDTLYGYRLEARSDVMVVSRWLGDADCEQTEETIGREQGHVLAAGLWKRTSMHNESLRTASTSSSGEVTLVRMRSTGHFGCRKRGARTRSSRMSPRFRERFASRFLGLCGSAGELGRADGAGGSRARAADVSHGSSRSRRRTARTVE